MSDWIDNDICPECKEHCQVVEVDFGIGRGEAWGVPFIDVNKQWVSNCCEAPMDGPGETYMDDREDWED